MVEVMQPLHCRTFWLIAGWFSCTTGHCALQTWAGSGQVVAMQSSGVTGPAREPGLTVHVNMKEVVPAPSIVGQLVASWLGHIMVYCALQIWAGWWSIMAHSPQT